MPYGLGKNSPIVLFQNRANFEALIERHGQWVRWRVAKKCPCVTTENRPDIQCEKCGGTGDVYDFIKNYEDVFRAVVRKNIIEIPPEYETAEVLFVYDAAGTRHPVTRGGRYLTLSGIDNNELVDVAVRVPTVKTCKNVELHKVGSGFYRVPDIVTEPSLFDGVHYRAEGDVIHASGLTDAYGQAVNALEYRRNMVLTDAETEIVLADVIEYSMPFRFVLLSQELKKADAALLDAHGGDAVCIFPYMYNLSDNDILTVLSGSVTRKAVIQKKAGDDTLPDFFVSQIDSAETTTRTYREGEDFVLVGTNRLHWIHSPDEGCMVSVTYRYSPTYRVIDVPSLRTSEDQRVPRKVPVKLFSAANEARGVNRQ